MQIVYIQKNISSYTLKGNTDTPKAVINSALSRNTDETITFRAEEAEIYFGTITN